MKILKCIRCGNVSAFPVDGGAHGITLKCPFCGFSDYHMSWTGGEDRRCKGIIDSRALLQIKEAFETVPEGCNANSVFDGLARKYELSTFSLIALSHVLCGRDAEDMGPGRFHRFRKLESQAIDGDTILEMIRSEIRNQNRRPTESESYAREEAISVWKDKYDEMKISFDKLSKNYETLKVRVAELKKELQSYKDMWN